MASFDIGDLIIFNYASPNSNDRRPKVLVLHPNWNLKHRFGKPRERGTPLVHALNFNYLTDNEINMIRMIISQSFEFKYKEALRAIDPNLVATFESIMSRAVGVEITSPLEFYLRVIKPFIQPKGYDPYRLYRPDRMAGTVILQRRQNLEGERIAVPDKSRYWDKYIGKMKADQGVKGPLLPTMKPIFGDDEEEADTEEMPEDPWKMKNPYKRNTKKTSTTKKPKFAGKLQRRRKV